MGKTTARKRNGKIELLRFLFCLAIILFHINLDLSDHKLMLEAGNVAFFFFKEGRIGVEFFFLVTGYLTASKIYSIRSKQAAVPSIGESTWDFMRRKIASILPYHFIVVLITIILKCALNHRNVFQYVIKTSPSIFLLQMTGLPGTNIISVEWYISSMLIALFILYPLCLRFYDVFTHVVAPLLGLFAIGLVINATGDLGHNTTYVGMFYAGNIRAVGVICLGMFSFEWFRGRFSAEVSRQRRLLLTTLELLCYGFTLYYMLSTTVSKTYGGMIAVILCFAVGLSFSQVTYGQRFFDNRLFCFLGKCSLTVYLSQNIMRNIGQAYLMDYPEGCYIWFVLLGSVALGILLICFVEGMQKFIRQKRREHLAGAGN